MLSRRQLLATPALAAALLPAGTRAAVPDNILAIARQIDDITSLDPHESFEASGGEIMGNIYDRLLAVDPRDSSQVVGDLAANWDVGDDSQTFTFRLKPDRLFASGAPVTAEDVAFSFQRLIRLQKAPAFILGQFGLTPENVGQAVRAADSHTLVLRIAEPRAPSFVLYCLNANAASIVEKAEVLRHAEGEDLGNGWLRRHSAGSGAYVLRDWRASESVILEANPRSPARADLKRVIIRHVPDAAAQLLQLRQGDIDIARNLSPDQIRGLEGDDTLHLVRKERAFLLYLGLNESHPMLGRPQVAQAIKWAIDYEGIERNLVRGTWSVHQNFLPAGMPGALTDKPFRHDPDRARELLTAAGAAEGFAITLDHFSGQPHSDIAQAIQADLGAIGIRVNLLSGEQRQVITKTRARQHEAALLYWGSDYYDPNSNAQAFLVNPDNSDDAPLKTIAWRNHWQNQALSRAAQEATREVETGRRLELYRDLQRRFRELSPLPILLQQQEVAATRRTVQGFELGGVAYRTLYAPVRKES
ncbi:MAG TPA: ABC transporter substrate-binding protein [Roseomonas sp.]|nr:ABC transporter substrate-binding protein [Roseomonas sp.]